MVRAQSSPSLQQLQTAIAEHAYWDEEQCVRHLLSLATLDAQARQRIQAQAKQLIVATRAQKKQRDALDSFLEEFSLDNAEGVALMCLAESLLRIPDADTADEFIHEKLLQGNWRQHIGRSSSLFVNASTWGLLLTGKWFEFEDNVKQTRSDWLHKVLDKMGEPLVRRCLLQAMKIMGQQYILGNTIQQALKRGVKLYPRETCFSFDALGEGARTQTDADRYLLAYQNVVTALNNNAGNFSIDRDHWQATHSVSIKLSALHPRYQYRQRQRVLTELVPKLKQLCLQAKQAGIALSIDAEEAERLDLELEIFSALAFDEDLRDWPGFGFVLQAYQKRAVFVAEWLIALARQRGTTLCVRLVKGAYWDREIKYAQQLGLSDYTVFTRKHNTDLSYLICAEKLLHAGNEWIYPQFATHNAMTIALVRELAGNKHRFELQRLHGMGQLLYQQLARDFDNLAPVRVYAPIGSHKELLPYLVRRLLENGANSSFVNRFLDEEITPEELCVDIIEDLANQGRLRHSNIPLPEDLFTPRKNSSGLDLNHPLAINEIEQQRQNLLSQQWPRRVASIINGNTAINNSDVVSNSSPSDRETLICRYSLPTEEEISDAFASAARFQPQWNEVDAERRANILNNAADALERRKLEFMSLICAEAGRTWLDAETEVREAVDFCRYYATLTRHYFSGPRILPGPTGESNQLSLHGRGVFVCISPWNFPLAIFCGQVIAALAAGNTVIAKPAEQTPLIAFEFVQLLLNNGVPNSALHLILGPGESVGTKILEQPQLRGVCFTGSMQTAQRIQWQLAKRDGPIVQFIAETGGINCMLVDSTALLEQVTDDVILSAFNSAGQRCSALRVLCVHDAIYDELVEMLSGACYELQIGDPRDPDTDIGPVIDEEAFTNLKTYCEEARQRFHLVYQTADNKIPRQGNFIGPVIFEINEFNDVQKEVFGPVLHLLRFKTHDLPTLVQQINQSEYGLTLGIHSRIEGWARDLIRNTKVGNNYINRNMVGAVVGVQPFGGQGLSGTGPKAGGPHYLLQFATEKTVTVNTVATGGNAPLFNLEE